MQMMSRDDLARAFKLKSEPLRETMRSDYALIASTIRVQHAMLVDRDNEPDRDAACGIRVFARQLAMNLAKSDPLFHAAEFLDACGIR